MIIFLRKYKQIIKYLIAGGTAAFVDLALLYILTDILGVWYLISACLAFAVAFFVSFFLQKFWTFRDADKEAMYKQMQVYLAVALANLTLNAVLMYVLVDGFKIWYMLAQVIVSGLIACESYFVYKIFIFNGHSKEKNSRVKILIATGIYPPDIGGPATYAENLSQELKKLNCEVKIITYGETKASERADIIFIDKTKNIFIKYLNYFWQVSLLAPRTDIIYILDLVSAGFPATLAAKLYGKKVIFRTGGDFLWEKAYHNGWTKLFLSKYYEQKKTIIEKFLFNFCRWLLKKIDLIIFSTKLQADIYEKYYGVAPLKVKILANALPAIKVEADRQFKNSIVFAGRLIDLKNLERLINAFVKIKQSKINLLLFGDGPEEKKLQKLIIDLGASEKIKFKGAVEHKELMSIISGCRFFILPSLTEISPNLALECVGLAKPVILTSENGLDKEVISHLLTINPLSEEDIKEKIEYLFNDNNLSAYILRLQRLNFLWREWNLVASEHLDIFKEILKNK
ncbi:MAG: glycosyltransferase [Candidatus Falkowbacteria bacterium]